MVEISEKEKKFSNYLLRVIESNKEKIGNLGPLRANLLFQKRAMIDYSVVARVVWHIDVLCVYVSATPAVARRSARPNSTCTAHAYAVLNGPFCLAALGAEEKQCARRGLGNALRDGGAAICVASQGDRMASPGIHRHTRVDTAYG